MQISIWLADWITARAVGTEDDPPLKPRTIESYADLATRYINPAIGYMELDDLTPQPIKDLLSAICEAGHSRTAEMCYTLLKTACKDLTPNPMANIRRPSHRQTSPVPWSDEEMQTYIAALRGHRHQLPLLLGALLGLRRGEICGLRWQDIDFRRGTIHICNQRQRMATGDIIDCTPKSLTSDRVLPIPPVLMPLMRSKRQIAGYLCTISPSGLDTAHRTLVRRLDLPYIPLHGLRHTMATSCIRHGGNMRSLQAVLGHASYATTANRYTHPDCNMLAQAIASAIDPCYNVLQ